VVGCAAPALAEVVTGLLAPLVAAVQARVSIAGRVLWGDAASAVASARGLVAAARPDAASRATVFAEHLLTTPPLAATAALRPPQPPDLRWTFRRRSCCLYYRVAGGGVCADCVLLDRRAPDR
jgi:ferric iron reductase protein FhuF